MVNILYLAHDLNDASVAKRTLMLKEGGAEVTLAGFRRGDISNQGTHEKTYDFGPTYNTQLIRRTLSVLKIIINFKKYQKLFRHADLILARNLEMLCIACAICSLSRLKTPIIYELLDIHRLLTEQNLKGKFVQSIEKICLKKVNSVLTSSPGFIRQYLSARLNKQQKIILIENKLYPAPPKHPAELLQGVVNIGWFGILRCRKSFTILTNLAQKYPDQIHILLAGKPALDQIPDFFEKTEQTDNIEYAGPYESSKGLPELYAKLHYCWAIDFYEEGFNSDWLLPNRLYESGYFNVPAIVRSDTESSHFLKEKELGIHLNTEDLQNPQKLLGKINLENYNNHLHALQKISQKNWVFDQDDCKELVKELSN